MSLGDCVQSLTDTCAIAGAALVQAIATIVLVGITGYYAKQTRDLVLEEQRDRAAGFLPLLHWQSPAATYAVHRERDAMRWRLNIVLWNIGAGAARVVLARVRSGAGGDWRFAHFDVPSIIPGREELTLRAYKDRTVEDVVRADDSHFLSDEDIAIEMHYDDVIEHRHYATSVVVHAAFTDLSNGGAVAFPMAEEPPEELEGSRVTTRFEKVEARSARRRLLKKCAEPECVANRGDGNA